MMPPFQEGPQQKLFSQEKKSKFCKQGGKQDYIDILLYLYQPYVITGKLSISFLSEMVITTFSSYLSLQYFTYSVSI